MLYCLIAYWSSGCLFWGLAVTILTTVGRLFVTLLVAFSYPIIFQPGRNSILGLWRYFDTLVDADEDAWIKHNHLRYVIVTVCSDDA